MSVIRVKKINFNSDEYRKALEIRKLVFVKEQDVPIELEICSDAIEENCVHFVGRYDEKIVATARYRVFDGYAKVERVATLPDFRGKGLAKQLMLKIQEEIMTKENLIPMLNSQESAVSFYLKLGWKIKGDEFFEAGIKHFKMIFNESNESK